MRRHFPVFPPRCDLGGRRYGEAATVALQKPNKPPRARLVIQRTATKFLDAAVKELDAFTVRGGKAERDKIRNVTRSGTRTIRLAPSQEVIPH